MTAYKDGATRLLTSFDSIADVMEWLMRNQAYSNIVRVQVEALWQTMEPRAGQPEDGARRPTDYELQICSSQSQGRYVRFSEHI